MYAGTNLSKYFCSNLSNIFAGSHREAADDGVTDDHSEAAEASETHEALDDSTTEGDGSHADHVW